MALKDVGNGPRLALIATEPESLGDQSGTHYNPFFFFYLLFVYV
jgi:hypothetical protein